MSFSTINGHRLHYEVLPAAGVRPGEPRETLVLIHGMLFDNLSSFYFTVAPAFAEAGFDVIMFDHRGHGKSKKIESGYQLHNVVDDLAALLDEIHDGTPVHVIGNSYGGTLAFSFALRYPERVATMTSIDAEPPTKSWLKMIDDGMAEAMRVIDNPEVQSDFQAQWGQQGMRLGRAAKKILDDTRFMYEMTDTPAVADDAIANLDMPVLAFYGSESEAFKLEPLIRELVPINKTVVAQGIGHMVLMDVPELVETEVISWVREHPAAEIVARRAHAQVPENSI